MMPVVPLKNYHWTYFFVLRFSLRILYVTGLGKCCYNNFIFTSPSQEATFHCCSSVGVERHSPHGYGPVIGSTDFFRLVASERRSMGRPSGHADALPPFELLLVAYANEFLQRFVTRVCRPRGPFEHQQILPKHTRLLPTLRAINSCLREQIPRLYPFSCERLRHVGYSPDSG